MKPVKLPKCSDCGTRQCHPVRVSADADGVETPAGYVWLCGSCEVLRRDPDAPRAKPLPRERTAALQRERLFDE